MKITMRPVSWILLSLLLLTPITGEAAIDVPDSAMSAGAETDDGPRVEARLLIDVASVAPGDTFRAGVLFNMQPDWHIYWYNQGQSGLPTHVTFEGPGLVAEPLQWPAPEVFSASNGFIITYGYETETLLFSTMTLSHDASGEVEITASIDYLACAVSCIPGQATLTRTLPIGSETLTAPTETVLLFESYRDQLPRTAEELGLRTDVAFSRSAITPDEEFTAAIALINCVGPPDPGETCPEYRFSEEEAFFSFVPELMETIDLQITGTRDHPAAFSGHIIEFSGYAMPDPIPENPVLAGIANLIDSTGETVPVQLSFPMPRAAEGSETEAVTSILLDNAPTAEADPESATEEPPSEATESPDEAAPESGSTIPLWKALLLALLGGIILNLMPCVLPVLALKVHGFIALGQEEVYGEGGKGNVRRALTSYILGVLFPMWILAGSVVAIRAAGGFVGWGSQFQYPAFIAIAGAIVGAFALNLFGVFQISLSAGNLGQAADTASGTRKNFLEGVITVILATPCSAPFLGSAVGFALIGGSGLDVFLVFSAIGIGLVTPFALLVTVPGWVKMLPKPGMWMSHFKQLVGFTFMAGVVWLAWIIGQSWGASGMTRFLIFLLTVSLVCWLIGVAQAAGRKIVLTTLFGLGIVVLSGFMTLQFELADTTGAETIFEHGEWLPFDEEDVSNELAQGRVVFVDFTADWCTTCKTIERFVLGDDAVVSTMERLNVATFIGDWTTPDARITEVLTRYGRAGVPLYLVYSPASPEEAVVLPETPTIEMVITALEEAAR